MSHQEARLIPEVTPIRPAILPAAAAVVPDGCGPDTPLPAAVNFISAPDVVVYCDPSMAGPLRAVGADFRTRTGVPVRVFGSPGTLQLELLARGTRNDILVTLVPVMDEAARRALVKPQTRAGSWRDPVVLAARDAASSDGPLDANGFARLLGGGRVAVIDPVDVDRMDGPDALRRLGWSERAAGRVEGWPTGQEVAYAVERGSCRLGLLHRSDLSGHGLLRVVGRPSPELESAEFTAAIGRNILSRYAADFLAYLTGAEAGARLRREGLEASS